jgi:hypothetical protein
MPGEIDVLKSLTLPSSLRDRLTQGAAISAALAGGALWLHAAGPGAHAGSDFGAYYTGAQAVAAGVNPYRRLVIELNGGVDFQANGYVYPPLLAVILALPVRLGLGYRAIWLLWNLLTAGMVLLASREIIRWTGAQSTASWRGSLIIAAGWVAPAVAVYDLWLGQADLLVAALAVSAGGLWARRSPWAALPIGAAIAIKPNLAVLLLLWLWQGDWRAVLRGVAAASALIAIPFAIVGLDALRDYLTFTQHWSGLHGSAAFINQALYGMILRLVTANAYAQPLLDAPWLVLPLRTAALGGTLALWAWAIPRGKFLAPHLAFAAMLVTLPLAVLPAPLAEDIHICAIIPALLGLGVFAARNGMARTWPAWTLWGAYALACIPRMQELIFPDRFLPMPGQSDPHIGWLIILARSGILLALTLMAFVAGAVALHRAHTALAPTKAQVRQIDD